jgi:hypothetical protein
LPDHYRYADHAILRMAQRDFSDKDIRYVLLHGDWYDKGDRNEVTLSRHHVLKADRNEFGHLAGSVVIMDDTGKWVITVYKARSRETSTHNAYNRSSSHWRSYLSDAQTN